MPRINRLGRVITITAITTFSIAGIAACSSGFQAFKDWGPQAVITEPQQYSKTIRTLEPGWKDAIAHFPKNIPNEAKRVKFLYEEPNVRFGGPFILELRMRLPVQEIKHLQTTFEALAERQYVPDGDNNSPVTATTASGQEFTYSYFFHTGPSGETFSKERAIYVLSDDRSQPEAVGYKTRYGVAIHEATSEIIYWIKND